MSKGSKKASKAGKAKRAKKKAEAEEAPEAVDPADPAAPTDPADPAEEIAPAAQEAVAVEPELPEDIDEDPGGDEEDSDSEVESEEDSKKSSAKEKSSKKSKEKIEDLRPSMTEEEEAEERWERTKSNFKTIGGAILLALFIRIVLFEAFEIDGPSMEPTLLNGDRVVVAKFLYGLFLPFTDEAVATWGIPNAGDVVIVRSPLDNIDIVKRVIGVPGDRIEIRDDVPYVNGRAIHHEVAGPCNEGAASEDPTDCEWIEEGRNGRTWLTSHSIVSLPRNHPAQIVPEGHIYVLGDHRDRSNDSRNPRVGMIPASRVKGRALAIYWSNEDGVDVRWDRIFESIR
jgi:signal peptidase I